MKARIKDFGVGVNAYTSSDESDELFELVGIHGLHVLFYHAEQKTVFDVEELENGYSFELNCILFEDIPAKFIELI
ncbi:hypothetical protein OPFAMLBM_00351 [Aeromonas phage avDM12-TAAL]|nr:hypothetical protein OPFAMLBM_00351 [Aeromonas phage avDM12-TAAL]